jgi:hypothetical protein
MAERPTIISRSGIRHVVGTPPGQRFCAFHKGRVTTYCGFGVLPEESLAEATRRDCEFCQRELKAELLRQVAEPAPNGRCIVLEFPRPPARAQLASERENETCIPKDSL